MQTVGTTILLLESYMKSLTKTEQKVGKYIMAHADQVIYFSVTELAERADVGETTVLRLCRKLKFKGFQDFKLSLAQDLVKPIEHLHSEITEEDDIATLKSKVFSSHIAVLEHTRELLQEEQLLRVVDLIVQAESIHFFGVGSSGLTAAQAALSFLRIGKRSFAREDTHFQAIDAAMMTDRMVAIGLSISGSTKDTMEHLQLAKQAGAKVVAITSNARSPITKLADHTLLMVSRETPMQGSSMTAKISQLAVIDILNVAVALRMQEVAIATRERTAKAISDKMF
ncbi:MurR/RpiR family transcriptional regulator [Paenibacillus yanchengensis]|uniref:MurR/RpiR family transcriptional regulator n=1 Tax=Paenibacillus yanchengensis TaxID=2035833 RepID=A0ABW4YIK0_9BACL